MLKGFFKMAFVLKEGMVSLVRDKALSTAVVGIVAAALIQLAVVVGVTRALDRALVSAKDRFELTVFLSAGVSEADRQRVQDLLTGDARVASVNVLTREEALEEFRKDPDIKRMLEALGENPLTDSLSVVLKPEATGVLDDLVEAVEGDEAVEEVSYGRGEWEAVSRLIRSVRLFGMTIAGLVLLAALLIVSNALALMLGSRRHERMLLSRLGAPGWARGGPFLLEGVLHGLLGAGTAVILLEAARRLLPYAVREATALNALLRIPASDWFLLYALLAAAGAALGCLGALLALRSTWARSGT